MQARLNPQQEQMLVERAKHDPEAFRTLYRHYFPRIYGYVGGRIPRKQDAEDVVADIFLSVLKGLPKFENRGEGAFTAWLFRIAYNAVKQFYRETSANPAVSFVDIDVFADSTPALDSAIIQTEKFARIRHLVTRLSPRRQEVVTLRFFAGLRNQEIADVLELDARTVAAHLCRAIDDLRRDVSHPVRKGYPGMTERDDNLLNQINYLLHEGQATGDDLLDTLAEAAPQADAGFQNRLEEQLMATRFATSTDERTSSVTTNGYLTLNSTVPQSVKTRPAVAIPFTLAALLLVVLLGGGLILTMQSNTNYSAIPAYVPQATPDIPSDLQPVVIALRDIRSRMYITPQRLAVVYWPAELVPDGAVSDIESLENTVATTDIAQYQPLTATNTTDVLNARDGGAIVEIPIAQIWSSDTRLQAGMVVTLYDDRTQTSFSGHVIEVSGTHETLFVLVPAHDAAAVTELSLSDRSIAVAISDRPTVVLPDGFVAVAIPRDSVQNPESPLQEGDWIAVWATMIFIHATDDPDFQRPEVVTRAIIEAAQVVAIDNEAGFITLAVRPQDATVLVWLVDAAIPLTFIEAEAPDNSTSE